MIVLLLGPPTGAAYRAAIVRRAARPCMIEGSEDVCRQLQNGEAPSGMGAVLSTSAGARGFFNSYLTEDEWTCADAEEPPAALADSLVEAPLAVLDVVLMNLVTGAASSSERRCSRARALVNALWARAPALRTSCSALRDTVAGKLGEEVPVLWDQNYEYAKDVVSAWRKVASALFDDSAPSASLDCERLGLRLRTPERSLSILDARRGLSSPPQAAPKFHFHPPGVGRDLQLRQLRHGAACHDPRGAGALR
jgi:hypothetical protein